MSLSSLHAKDIQFWKIQTIDDPRTQENTPNESFGPILSGMSGDMGEIMPVPLLPLISRHIQGVSDRVSDFCDIPWIHQ